jgi:hypothetical protein
VSAEFVAERLEGQTVQAIAHGDGDSCVDDD